MSNDRRSTMQGKRKLRKRRRIFFWVILPVIILSLSATSYGAFLYHKAQSVFNSAFNPLDRDKRTAAVQPHIDNFSILIIGVDASDKRGLNAPSRSDALMLATFNKKTKSVKLVSIPRDSYVYIPKLGYQTKINHAHANGGAATTIQTVENLLDIPVDFYVKVNFNAFIDIVDALGGIKVDVPYAFSEQNSKDKQDAISLEPGLQLLDGEEALALARTRKLDNDVERGKRQQEIIKAIIDKAISVGSISKYGDLMEAVGKNMETDISFDQMKAFINYGLTAPSLDIETLTLDGQDLWIPNSSGNRIYYYGLDEENLAEIKIRLKEHLNLGTSAIGQSGDSSIEPNEMEQAQGEY